MKKPREEGRGNMTQRRAGGSPLNKKYECTAVLEQQSIDESIRLSMAPHGPAVETKDPREVVVEVDAKGRISIARSYMNDVFLKNLLRNVVISHGQTTPVIIRAAGGAKHEDVRKVMDACAYAGLWKVSFAATKDAAQK